MNNDFKNLRVVQYLRKSTDSEDRQVQSISDQERELKPTIQREGLKVVKTFRESQSAKKPGRPDFGEMIAMIERGEADAILGWKVNRLARNPIDGGRIQWLLQQGVIKAIITPYKIYVPSDNVLMMAVELGMATQYSIDLGNDVSRGMDSKVAKGWRPMRACLGYLNDPIGVKGEKKIYTDPDRFSLVRKMWNFLLTGAYTVPQIIKKANDEWGLRNRDGKIISRSGAYKIFTNSFYYGEFNYKGEAIVGKHEPMITKLEFDLCQRILGRAGKPRPKFKRLPFTGVISCGECGSMITAEEKTKFIKSQQKLKQFVYNRCSRGKTGTVCHQKPIKYEDLAGQVQEWLGAITIPSEFLQWAIEVLRENNEIEERNRDLMLRNHRHNFDSCLTRIDNLISLYVSQGNASRELLSEAEYKAQKNSLIAEKAKIESEIRKLEQGVEHWIDLTEQTFEFATYAKAWFDKGDYEQKTHILRAIGQNFTLMDGKLNIDLQKPFLTIREGLQTEPLKSARLEPAVYALHNGKNTRLESVFSQWSG